MKILPLLILFVFFTSCKKEIPNILFEKPLPENGNNIVFPNFLIGDYYNSETETFLEIKKTYILKKHFFYDTLNLKEKLEIEKENFENVSSKISFSKLNDSLFLGTYKQIDTVFNLEESDILRKLKSIYILNKKYDDLNYSIKILSYKKGLLNIQKIDSLEILSQLNIKTEKLNDTIYKPVKAFPTKKQFKALIKTEGFEKGETYLKIQRNEYHKDYMKESKH